MEMFAIANKNLKMLFRSVLFIIFIIGIPIFMIYFMKMTIDNTSVLINSSQSQGFIEMVVLSPSMDNFFLQTFVSGILVQFLLIASTITASMVVSERENNTLMRMFIAPITKVRMLAGISIGHTVFFLIITFVIILTTYFLFGIYWGSWISILIITLLAAYVATAFAFVITGIFKNGKTAAVVMSIVISIMTFMSGSIVQGDKFDLVSKFTLNKWIADAYLKLMTGQTLANLLTNILTLGIIGTVFMIIAVLIHRKEGIYE
ncbi:MAG: ABC transporter permease [Clostridia bacterium]|nr:ABC transporter permease [Clostridia bacterium]